MPANTFESSIPVVTQTGLPWFLSNFVKINQDASYRNAEPDVATHIPRSEKAMQTKSLFGRAKETLAGFFGNKKPDPAWENLKNTYTSKTYT